MNVGKANIVLRHRDGLEVLDLTLRFVRALAPRGFILLSLITLLPAWICCLFLKNLLELPWFSLWLGALCACRILEVPFTILSGNLLFDREVHLKFILLESLRAMPRAVFGLLLYGLLITFSVLLIIGPLLVGANFFFLPEVLILEKFGPIASFRRSSRFLSGRSGIGIEGMVLRSALLATFVILGEALGQAFVEYGLSFTRDGEQLWIDGGSEFALAGLFLFVPYGAAHRFLSYINERTRQDGWDVQVAFQRLRSSALNERPETAGA